MILSPADLIALERAVAAESLAEFVKMAWHVVEPAEVYIHGWHVDVICEHLEATVPLRIGGDPEITRLLLNVPPGTMKSTIVSVFFPAWLWGPKGRSHHRFIGASYEQTLATRDSRRTRTLIESEWFQRRWPTKLTVSQDTYFENTRRGFRQSSSVTSTTGKRGHTVAWDDPHNPEGSTSDPQRETTLRILRETLPTRVVDPKRSAIIVIMQRLHQNDVSGYILEQELGYTHVMLPMEFEPERCCYTVVVPKRPDPALPPPEPILARYDGVKQSWYRDGQPIPNGREVVAEKPLQTVYRWDRRTEEGELLFEDRFPREVVERDKKVLLEYGSAGQFQQRPSPRGGGMFKREHFRVIPAIPAGLTWCRGWDLAATAQAAGKNPDWTVGLLLGRRPDGGYVIGNVRRLQENAAGVKRALVNTASADHAALSNVIGSLPQDPGQAGKSQVQDLIAALAGFRYSATPESGDKVTRAEPVASQAQVGNIEVVAGPWNEAFFAELETFPNGKHDDQVDARSRAFNSLLARPSVPLSGAQR